MTKQNRKIRGIIPESYPPEWESYCVQSPIALEIVSSCIYKTWEWWPGMEALHYSTFLPNPQSFLIQRIKIFGTRCWQQYGTFDLTIGHKIYIHDRPLWSFQLRDTQVITPCLMISPLVMYTFSITKIPTIPEFEEMYFWSERPPEPYKITVALFGEHAWPIQ